jgi:hypothetical protein
VMILPLIVVAPSGTSSNMRGEAANSGAFASETILSATGIP